MTDVAEIEDLLFHADDLVDEDGQVKYEVYKRRDSGRRRERYCGVADHVPGVHPVDTIRSLWGGGEYRLAFHARLADGAFERWGFALSVEGKTPRR